MSQARLRYPIFGTSVRIRTALAAILVERGQLSWDTTLADLLPNLPGVLPVYQTATLEQFLSHRAGVIPLTDFSALPRFSGDIHQQRLAFISWALSQPPAAPPGTQTLYSNAGYVIAAAMLESALNETWEQALTAEVLIPLGISGRYGWPGAGDPNQPWGHTWHNNMWVPNDPNSADNLFPPVLNPAGNLSMSLDDDAKWALLNLRGLQGVNSPILSAASIQRLHTAVGVPPGQPGYALGWGIALINGHLVSYHLGSAGTFDAEIGIDATGDRAIVIMANGDNSGDNYTPKLDIEDHGQSDGPIVDALSLLQQKYRAGYSGRFCGFDRVSPSDSYLPLPSRFMQCEVQCGNSRTCSH